MEKGSAEADIVIAISCEFSTCREVVKSDVHGFIESLRKYKLVGDP
jgi:hypothetical protein